MRPVLFLERRSYRKRRLMDALRLLPVAGMLLWMLPLFWPTDGTEAPVSTSVTMIYVFGIWTLLIIVSMVLALYLRDHLSADLEDSEAETGGD